MNSLIRGLNHIEPKPTVVFIDRLPVGIDLNSTIFFSIEFKSANIFSVSSNR